MTAQVLPADAATRESLERIAGNLATASEAKKCHACGCFQDAVSSLAGSALAPPLADTLAQARTTFVERQYECIGCETCWPAEALSLGSEIADLTADLACPTSGAEERDGWPPLAGDYRVLRYRAPVAICTLHSLDLVARIATQDPEGVAIIGALQTENLGIERVVQNSIANPHVRVLIICGEDTPGRVGHLPGQTMLALLENGLDERSRIIGAPGKRPVLRNIQPAWVDRFRSQVTIVDRRGLTDPAEIAREASRIASTAPPPIDGEPLIQTYVRAVQASAPERLVLDPAGYVVIFPDRGRTRLIGEHYDRSGVIKTVIEATNGVDLAARLLREGAASRTDHAAYIGRECERAAQALSTGEPYVQDRAPGGEPEPSPAPYGCGPAPSEDS